MLPASRYDFFGHCKRGINKVEALPRRFIITSEFMCLIFTHIPLAKKSVTQPDCKGLGNKILLEIPEKNNKMDSHTKLSYCQN